MELALEGDLNSRTWTLLGNAQQLERSNERQRILDLLAESKDAMSPTEIAGLLQTPSNNIRQLLHSMYNKEQDPLIVKVGRGKYTLTEKADNNNNNDNNNNDDNKITNDSQNLLSPSDSDNNQNNKNIIIEPSYSKGYEQLVIGVTDVTGGKENSQNQHLTSGQDTSAYDAMLEDLGRRGWMSWVDSIRSAVSQGVSHAQAMEVMLMVKVGSIYRASGILRKLLGEIDPEQRR